jgi:hypothetical protein
MRDVMLQFDSNRMAEEYYDLYNTPYTPKRETVLVNDLAK